METLYRRPHEGWTFDDQRQSFGQFDALERQYRPADGPILQQPGYPKPQSFVPAQRPAYVNDAPLYSSSSYSEPGTRTYSFSPAPAPPPPPPPPPPDYRPAYVSPTNPSLSPPLGYRSSYTPHPSRYGSIHKQTPSRLSAMAYPSTAPRFTEPYQGSAQTQPPPQQYRHAYPASAQYTRPPAPYYAAGREDQQTDRNRLGRNHDQDNNPPAYGGPARGGDNIDDDDERQAYLRTWTSRYRA